MSISTIQNFFKETITRAVTLVGATNIYVSALPTPSEGYVVISPSSSSLREIVYYTAKGTDGNGSYLTVTADNRGLGGTTAQTHTIGEPVRMNVTAEHIKEISDALDQIVAEGAQDASTTTKGISKLSVAPVSATEPIAVGDNDPRLVFVSENFGDGSDGDVTISAGTTTLTRDMYYDNLVITGTLATDGYKVYVKGTVSGAGILQGVLGANGAAGTDRKAGGAGGAGGAAAGGGIFKSIAGGAGGAAAAGDNTDGVAGTAGTNGNLSIVGKAGGAGGNGAAGGGAGGAGGTLSGAGKFVSSIWSSGILITPAGDIEILKAPGSGGGGGGGGGSQSSAPGAGGGGGATGGLVFLCAKNWDGTFTIKSTGGNGGNGGSSSPSAGTGGGGGGGNGGPSVVIYSTKTWTGSYLLTGGTGGVRGSGSHEGANGTDGASGTSYEINVKTLI